ncbi:MAG: PIN domain-containing protein [bacterium]
MIGKFFDTNILIYAYDIDVSEKHGIAVSLLRETIRKDKPILSVQVLNEFFVVVTRKIQRPFSLQEAKEKVEQLISSFTIVDLNFFITIKAIDVMEKNRLSFWDSLIISAAKEAKATLIFSEDLNSGQIIEGIKVINPFCKE